MVFPDSFIAAGYDYADLDHFVAAPLFRKAFVAPRNPKAELVIGVAGFYKVFVNGRDITKGELAPYISNPDDLVYYDRYDVSDSIHEGKNVVAVLLGNGFQNNPGGAIWDFDKAPWRGAPKFALRLSLYAEDGGAVQLESDESFKVCDSPILFDDYRCGEYYDARFEIPDFHCVDFDDSGLKNAIKVKSPRGEKRLCTADPVRIYGELKPVAVSRQKNGWLYDFGENNTGVCRLSVNGAEGQKITLYYAEWLKNGEFNRDNIRFGHSQTELQREAVQKSEYICKSGKQSHIPSFSYNGFRYVLVQGITDEQATEDLLTYLKMSSLHENAGHFTCSCEVVNKIQEITLRSDISNFVYFPTDCPQREKNGWTADASLSSEQLLFNFHPEKSYKEWMRSIYKALNDKGQLPGIIPTGGWGYHWGNGPAWDNVIINLPYYTYIYRGDKEMLDELSIPLMRYLNYLFSRIDDKGLIAIGLGDWCQPSRSCEDYETPLVVTDSILTYDIAQKAAFVYDVLGKEPQKQFAMALAERVKRAFRENLLDKDGGAVYGNTQTGQAMAIFCGLLTDEEKPKAFELLLKYIEDAHGHFNTGVLGGRVIYRVLAENGKCDLAYDMITRPDYPSYGNWVKRGATTLWECFDPSDDSVASLNHHFWGDVSAWFYTYLAGIKINPTGRDVTNVDDLLEMNNRDIDAYGEEGLPIIFNEWGTYWGDNSEEKLLSLAHRLEKTKVKYFVMDDGWQLGGVGDWDVNLEKFPMGLKHYTDQIRAMGMVPGIWMEFECVHNKAKHYSKEYDNLYLTKDGRIIVNGAAKFLDLRKPEVISHLDEKVIRFLKENGIGYLKIEHRKSITVRCGVHRQLSATARTETKFWQCVISLMNRTNWISSWMVTTKLKQRCTMQGARQKTAFCMMHWIMGQQ